MGALVAYPSVEAPRLGWVEAAVAVAAFVCLAVGLALARAPVLVSALALVGATYAVWLGLGAHSLDQRMPIVGAGLLLAAELGFDALEPEVARPEASVLVARAIVLVLVVLAAVGAGALVLAAASIPLSGGLGMTALGTAAALLLLGLIARLVSERRSTRTS